MNEIPELQRALLDPAFEAKNWKVFAEEQGVHQLVTAAKTEALFLSTVDQMLPERGYFSKDLDTARDSAKRLLNSQKIENEKTQKQFIDAHKEGKTFEIIKDNLNKLADGAKKEYFRGFFGIFRRIASWIYQSDSLKEIQALRALAEKDLKLIQGGKR